MVRRRGWKKRNYHREYMNESPQRRRRRAMNKRARRMLMREGKVRRGDGMHVDHIRPLSKGGTNARRNLRVKPGIINSSFDRNKDSSIK